MLISRVSYRFAKALLQLAVEKNDLEKVIGEITLVNKTLDENRDLRVMLDSPVIKTDKKQKIFLEIFGKNLGKGSTTFFNIIFRRSREELIFDITKSFINQYKEFKKIHIIKVETATPLSPENRERVMEFLKTRTNEGIELIEEVNEELIGGIILKMNDLQIDASVKNNLNKLEKEFSRDLYSVKF